MSATEYIGRLRGLLSTIRAETAPVPGHVDPGAIEDCWLWVSELVNDIDSRFGQSDINAIAARQWQWVESVGWHKDKRPLEFVALIASEVGEVANECRDDVPSDALGEELADVILRALDMAHHFGLDIEAAIHRKMVINAERGTRGRKK